MRLQPANERAIRRLGRTLMAAGLLLLSIDGRAAARTFSPRQTAAAALTFSGVEAIAQSEPCTAVYTDNDVGTTVCSVYTGTIAGTAVGNGPAPAIINMTITGLNFANSNPGCVGMYINVQFAGTADSQTLYGFGSLCGPTGSNPPVQSGAKLIASGGYGIASSQADASGTGQFTGTFTPERGVAGDNLVMTFSSASSQATSGQ